MGITGLSKAIRSMAPRAVRVTKLSDYKGMRFAIDGNIFMYKLKYICSPSKCLADLFEKQVHDLRDADILPIYYFDGKSTEAKQAEVERRRAQRERDHEVLQERRADVRELSRRDLSTVSNPLEAIIEAEDALRAAERRVTTKPRSDDFSSVYARLRSLGVEVRRADHDAEAACAQALLRGEADVAVTEDFDALPYGATRMLTKLGHEEMVEYRLDVVLEDSHLTKEQFIDFCILSGSDLCGKIKGIGEKRALVMLREHGNIERILERLPSRFHVPEDFDFRRARAQFLGQEVVSE